MYTDLIDDVSAVRRFVKARDALRNARKEEDDARGIILSIMARAQDGVIETDEYVILQTVRNVITVDRKALEVEFPDVYREVCVLGNQNVIHVHQR